MNTKFLTPETESKPVFSVGVLMDSAEGFFNHRIITDLVDAANEHNIRLFFFFGGQVDNDQASVSPIFSLPGKETIQALIVLPHLISPHKPTETTKRIIDKIKGIPVYSLLASLPDFFSVWTNEDQSIKQMIQHLAEDHAYTDFAIVTGPISPGSTSDYRIKIIKQNLKPYTIQINPDLIFQGNFTAEDGKNAAKAILSRSEKIPDILIGLNDQMAMGAIQEFRNNGIRIPEDIAVVGFDDVAENNAFPFSITTINIPVWQVVSLLMQRISSDLDGKSSYENLQIEIESEFMHRESCGCNPWYERASADNNFTPLTQRRSSAGTLKKVATIRHTLEDIIEKSINKNDASIFSSFITNQITDFLRTGDIGNSVLDTLATQWTITLVRHPEPSTQNFVNALFIDVFRLLVQEKTQIFTRIHANDMGILSFYQNCNALFSQKKGTVEAIKGIASNLPQMGIDFCMLVFFSPGTPEKGEVRLAYKQDSFMEIPENNFIQFPLKQIVDSRAAFIMSHLGILPISYNNTEYGYLVLSIQDKHFESFAMIQKTISQIIDTAMSNDILSNHIRSLTEKNDTLSRLSVIDEFTGLFNRRALHITGKKMYQQAQDNGESSCFIFLDMDGLKKINDSYGHKEGDAAILALATILRKCFREKDLIVRYGGDEFVVLMINIREDTVNKILKRIVNQFDEFNKSHTLDWHMSASWGVVFNKVSSPDESFEAIIEESDAHLYEQKRKRQSGF